jgi:PAS domain S-box-containing protein
VREKGAPPERFRRVVEAMSHAVVISDLKRQVRYANPAAHALFGAAPGDLVGCTVDELIPPEALPEVARRHAAATKGEPQHYETEVIGPGGDRRVVSVQSAPLEEDGAITGSIASLLDITEEKRAHDARAELDARYQRLVETAADAIFTIDREGRFTSVNKAMEFVMERKKEDLIGHHFREILHGPMAAAAAQLFEQNLRGKRGRTQLAYPMRSGETRYGSVNTAPIVENGQVTGGVGIMRDVTEERRLADQLLQREKLAAIGQLVSGVAHELNNPLAGILAFAQLLEGTPQSADDQHDALATIQREAKRASKIVANLLLFARQRSPERTPTDLNQVLRDTLELRRYVLRTQQVEVVTQLDETLPRTWADAFQLQQVALNLITNAEQALRAHDGAKCITLATRMRDGFLEMSVSDTGLGIPSAQLDQVFNPFFTTKAVGEGTGLGLAISDGIVRQHGGTIRVESREGAGATFTIVLPLQPPPTVVPAPPPRLPESPGPPANFLLVDDEPAIRAALAIHLRREGHRVDAAESGREALVKLGHRRYDAIFLDLRMPDMSGVELYARLRKEDPGHAARVVFATGDVDAAGAREFLRAAGRPFLAKPFELTEVSDLLAQVARDA